MSGTIASAFAGFQTAGLETSAREIDRVTYARDLWPRHHIAVRDGAIAEHKPALVVWPRTTEDVAAIVGVCAREGFSIAPFGAGSGVCGGTLPDPRTVVVDLKKLERVRAIEGDVLDVEAGAMGIRLEEDLVARGHTLGHFPSSILCSTVGGWIAGRSAGQCSGLYGKIEDMVVELECVVGRGEIVRFKRRLHGPDLTPILTGSEGILGVITAARLRIHRAPEERTFVAFSFPTVKAGCDAIRDLFQSGLRPAVSRLYDPFDSWMAKRGRVSGSKEKKPTVAHPDGRSGFAKDAKQIALRTLLRAPGLLNEVVERGGDHLFGGTTLVLVFEGTRDDGQADLARARLIAARHRGADLGEAPARHWFSHRYSVSYRQAPVFMSGAFSDTMEVAAPWSKLERMYDAVRRAMKSRVFVMAHFSHAYPDGCSIYFTFAGSSPTRAESEAKYDAVWADAMDAVLAAGGTLSHHHGVGRSKAPRMGAELGLGVPIVHAMKRALDPAGILNPGNLLPRESPRRLAGPPAPRETTFDDESLLAHARGDATLGAIEDAALARGLSLRVRDLDRAETLAAFIARGGAAGLDSYEDPPDHQIAGFVAKVGPTSSAGPPGPSDAHGGETLVVRPGPRRAVGPDLHALFHGMRGRVGDIRDAFVRVHRNGLEARALPAAIDRDPPIGRAEGEWIDRVVDAAREARFSD